MKTPKHASKHIAASEEDRKAVEAAIQSLPDQEKAAFLEAKKKVPHLVRKESDPGVFLRDHKNDLVTAAKLLASYWTKRRELFGVKAFLPLNQTGEGALNRADNALLSTGFMTLLCHKAQTVLSYDASKITKPAKNSDLRVAFYWMSLALEFLASSSQQEIAVVYLDNLVARGEDVQSIESVVSVFPIRIKEVHAIADKLLLYDAGGPTVASVKKMFGAAASSNTVPHAYTDRLSVVRHLQSCGVSKKLVPKAVGGEWGFEHFVQWQELRTRLEWDLPAGSGSSKASLEPFDFSGVRTLSQLSPVERVERKRRMNVLHSRRKRERERIEIEVLQEQSKDLEDRKGALMHEQKYLEKLLAESKAKVARLEHCSSPGSASPAPKDAAMESEASCCQSPIRASTPNKKATILAEPTVGYPVSTASVETATVEEAQPAKSDNRVSPVPSGASSIPQPVQQTQQLTNPAESLGHALLLQQIVQTQKAMQERDEVLRCNMRLRHALEEQRLEQLIREQSALTTQLPIMLPPSAIAPLFNSQTGKKAGDSTKISLCGQGSVLFR